MANAPNEATSGALPGTSLVWEEAVARFLEWGRRKARPFREQTLGSYESDLRFWGACFSERGIAGPGAVTSADVEGAIESKTEWAPSTKGRRLNCLSYFYRKWAVRHGFADRNPVEGVERPGRRDNEYPMVSPDDFCRMRLQACNVLEAALLLTLALTGVRHSELLGINLSDIDRELPGVTIRDGKGGKTRVVPLSPRLAKAWTLYLQERSETECTALFVTADGKRLTKRVTNRMWKRWLRDAGLAGGGYVVHSCRVTFNTLLDRLGVDQRTIAELMGHGPKNMTVWYTRTDMPRKQDAVARLDEALLGLPQRMLGHGAVQVAGAGVQVGGRGVEPGVPEHLRQGIQVAAALQHEAREGVPQRVEGAAFRDPSALEGTSQYGREALAAQRGVADRREQPVVPTQPAEFQPVGQLVHEAGGQGQQPALSALAALDPHGALGQIDGRHLQGQQLRLAQATEHEQPQYGPVTEGMGEGGLSLCGGEEPVALFRRQPGGKGTFPLRDGHPQEGVGLGVPVVPDVLPEGAERGEPPGDAVRLVPLGAQPRDVAPDELAVNVLRTETVGGLPETAEEQPEVGGVSGDGQQTAVTLDFQI